MTKQYFIFIIINIIILFNSIDCISNNACNKTNTDCQTCLNVNECGFCKTTKECFWYGTGNVLNPPCSTSDMQYKTCVGNFRAWIIVVIVVVCVVLLAIIIVICCFCRKCKRCAIRREKKRQQARQEADDQRMEERRAAAEIRTTERNRVADQIRMKYGMLKENDNSTDYTRMN